MCFRTVNVCSTQQLEKTMNGQQQCVASHLVSSMIESVCSMWRLKMSPEFVSFFDVEIIFMPFTNVRFGGCAYSITFYQSPLILTELFQHNLINIFYLTACYLYQVMMTLHFLNDVANDAESTQK